MRPLTLPTNIKPSRWTARCRAPEDDTTVSPPYRERHRCRVAVRQYCSGGYGDRGAPSHRVSLARSSSRDANTRDGSSRLRIHHRAFGACCRIHLATRSGARAGKAASWTCCKQLVAHASSVRGRGRHPGSGATSRPRGHRPWRLPPCCCCGAYPRSRSPIRRRIPASRCRCARSRRHGPTEPGGIRNGMACKPLPHMTTNPQ